MRVQREVLAPGVQDGGDAERPAGVGREVPGIAGEGGERVGGGAEEEIVDDPGSVKRQGADLVGQGEDDVEGVDGEKVSAPRLEPVGLSQRLTLRAVTVAARVVDGPPQPAAVTRFEVTAEGRGAALAEGPEHLVLDGAHRMRGDGALAMVAQDLAQLGRPESPGRSRGLRGCTHEGLLEREVEQIRADTRRAACRLREMEGARRCADRSMSEQPLEGMEVDASLEHPVPGLDTPNLIDSPAQCSRLALASAIGSDTPVDTCW